MLEPATDAVNTLCTFAQDQPMADFDAREERVLEVGRRLQATWLGQRASAAGPRSPACPQCGVHSLNAVRRRRKPRTMNSRCGTVHIPRVRLTCRGCGHSWLPLQTALGVGAQQRTSGGLPHWAALVDVLTISAQAAPVLEAATSFAPRLGTEAAGRGALDLVGWRGLGTDGGGQEAVLRRVVVLGDGAKWIWEHVATIFGCERVEILDWYHCCQHVWTIGAAVQKMEIGRAHV